MDHDYINFSVLKVFKDCEVYSFPINCFDILKYYQISVYPYSSLDDALREYCISYSDDALNYKGKLCYNDKMPEGRIRFTLIHELGHIILKHGESPSEEQEKEADFFSSHFLTPRMAIHYARCKNQNDVAKTFQISQEAAQYAFDDYRRWHRRTIIHKMTDFDKAMYAHFYNIDAKCFVYNINRCAYCDSLIYNSNDYICKKCKPDNLSYMQYQRQDEELLIAEGQWLYGGL
jgi:predicted HD phosphohydrolase